MDGRATSSGAEGQGGRRNTPSVLNAATHVAQFLDGRAITVEAQAVTALTNPVEMGMLDEHAVVDEISRVPRYVEMFHRAFPGEEHPISLHNVGEAIGAFERGLVTKSRWDQFIAGDHADGRGRWVRDSAGARNVPRVPRRLVPFSAPSNERSRSRESRGKR